MKHLRFPLSAGLVVTLFAAAPAAAQDSAAAKPAPQQPAPAQAAPAPAAQPPADFAKQLGLSVYPAKQQTPAQQAKDEQECYAWAKQQTGIDPMGPATNADSAAKATQQTVDSATRGAAVGGAARGAVAGTAIGAIAGDAGKGAAIGATAGAIAGRRAKKNASAEAANAGAKQASAKNASQIDTFKRSVAACLEGRGYTAK